MGTVIGDDVADVVSLGGIEMNWDVIEGDWEQYKGHVRAQWRELTNDHLESIAGERNQLLGQLQQSYGIQHGEAEMQINAFQKYLRES